MTHAFVTVAIPFASEQTQRVNESLDRLGNPARGPAAAALYESAFVHFMSINVVQVEGESRAHLVLAVSADGSESGACARVAKTIGTSIVEVLEAAALTVKQEHLGAYLEQHRLDVGPGWHSTTGVVFSGTPGMSVQRIRDEALLASWISDWLEHNFEPEPALQKLQRARNKIYENPDLKWAFIAEPVPVLGERPPVSMVVRPIIVSLVRSLLWPLLLLPVLAAIVCGLIFRRSFVAVVWAAISGAFLILGLEIVIAGVGLWIAYRWLRRQEDADAPKDEQPSASHAGRLMASENIVMQNHLAGASILKPGLVRRLILRFVFWAVSASATYAGRPGFLSGIGTIHFARWLILPRTDTLLFLSNYDGSWESYLEDFIARAHARLSAIWSNTRDFPKTRNLTEGGASDGERFKRWARRLQVPTHFWFSAYPNLKAVRIRTNAAIRHGFASATTEEGAAQWLTSMGFPIPSALRLESEMIPTLVFGGLSPLRHALCLIVELEGCGPVDCRDWLRDIAKNLSYGDGVPTDSAVLVGFSAGGLRKLGLDGPTLATFPTAFQQGMAAPWRARALGDTGGNAPANWWWGCSVEEGGQVGNSDVIILLYAKDPATLQGECEKHKAQLRRYGHRDIHHIAMATLPENRDQPIREPFRFMDGISQPIIRGTGKWNAVRSPLHVLEPGEFIIGYRDNLQYFPPMPCSHGFPIGHNGTFLVARQLEQDPKRFEQYLDDAAAAIVGDPRAPSYAGAREWIAAKMVGRWREDGTSLVRHPTPPGTPGRTTVARDNDFLFGAEDPDGLRCPFGAHIRRANPRESFDPGSQIQIGITNRHRVLRVGRAYDHGGNGDGKPGLLFMCLNTDFEGQFEFLQQTWVLGRDFQGLRNESDAIVGQHRDEGGKTTSIPTQLGPLRLPDMKEFVTVRGGGYFFMPGKAAVDFLTR